MISNKLKEIEEALDNAKLPFYKRFIVCLFSILLSLLIISGPLAILINLMLFTDYRFIISLTMAVLLGIFGGLCYNFYIKGVTKGTIKKIYPIVLIFGFIVFLVGIIVVIILRIRGII